MAKAGRKAAEKLAKRQRWYDQQPESYKRANKRPGSVKL